MRFSQTLETENWEFTASEGWLDRFKKRFHITIGGKALSADKEAVFLFRDCLAKLIQQEGISRGQLYIGDETGLNYKRLSAKTFASQKETAAA